MKYLYVVLVLVTSQSFSQVIVETEGGGEYKVDFQDYQPLFHQLNTQLQYEKDRQHLESLGLIEIPQRGVQPSFIHPLRGTNNDPNFYGISNYVDQNLNFNGQLLDYNCGQRTYDLNNYNHRGIDMFTWPFKWYKMDHDQVEVVAAADGVITTKLDGNFDRNCDFSNPNWNAVFITHSDGSYSYYGHLKKNSLTTKSIGQSVVAGEYLGVVGSSGASTGPHLHFETYTNNNNLIEPFSGACNAMNNDSWWLSQEPYYNSQINLVATHDAVPHMSGSDDCPTTVDTPNFKDHFNGGDLIYFAAYYRDQLQNQQSNYKIYKPNGQIYQQWNHASTVAHYAASWWWRSFVFPTNADHGAWRYEVTYEGQTYSHTFFVGDLIFTNDFE